MFCFAYGQAGNEVTACRAGETTPKIVSERTHGDARFDDSIKRYRSKLPCEEVVAASRSISGNSNPIYRAFTRRVRLKTAHRANGEAMTICLSGM
uniref:Uncharacterized protein n=1 Tax=mine drainage metagenome TaxID=410659 RepID=E6QSG5_9ZZZZ